MTNVRAGDAERHEGALRNAAGDRIHDMKIKAQVPCGCTLCAEAANAKGFAAELAGVEPALIPALPVGATAQSERPF